MPVSKNESVGSPRVDRAGVAQGDIQADRAKPAPRDGLADRNANIQRLTARARQLRNELRVTRRANPKTGKLIKARIAMAKELHAVELKMFQLMQMPLFSWMQDDR